jgi:protein gp37
MKVLNLFGREKRLMNNTKIEWCDGTWNPVTGCLHKCPYCYARKIANRFGTNTNIEFNPETTVELITAARNPYPYGFHPTFHKYRLDELKNKKAQNIFVCSMADLFGDWVPDEWIIKVFQACKEAPQHNYIFLTKNPRRLDSLQIDGILPVNENFWFGTTITGSPHESPFISKYLYNAFVSCEPLQTDISEYGFLLTAIWGGMIKWVIIGAETGNRKDKIIPRPEWIVKIAEACKENDIPVFMKDSLIPIIGQRNMLREFPEILTKERS